MDVLDKSRIYSGGPLKEDVAELAVIMPDDTRNILASNKSMTQPWYQFLTHYLCLNEPERVYVSVTPFSEIKRRVGC